MKALSLDEVMTITQALRDQAGRMNELAEKTTGFTAQHYQKERDDLLHLVEWFEHLEGILAEKGAFRAYFRL